MWWGFVEEERERGGEGSCFRFLAQEVISLLLADKAQKQQFPAALVRRKNAAMINNFSIQLAVYEARVFCPSEGGRANASKKDEIVFTP